jgi:NADPH-dependent ferric siderophore reductase
VPMTPNEDPPPTLRARREPPRYRRVAVRRVEHVSPRLVRVTLTGGELDGFGFDEPAASVRLLIPTPGTDELVMPSWNGNEFLLPDGSRPTIRTLTPVRADPDSCELEVDIVVHEGGTASGWAAGAAPGAPAAVSGPGRGYDVDPDADAFLLAGDETAIPAIRQVLEAVPATTPVHVAIEIARPDARLDLPDHPAADVRWCDLTPGADPGDALLDAVRHTEVLPGTKVWAAGEAAAMQRIRRHLFDERGLTRADATIRGYWKRGRRGE